MRKLIAILAAGAALTVAACGGSSNNDVPVKHVHHAQVYQSGGETYASTYDPTTNLIIWWMITQPTTQDSTPTSWGRVSTPPSSPTPVVGKSVEFNDKGEPESAPEDTPEGETVVDENTDPAEAEAEINAENSEADAATEAESSSDDSSSESSSDDSSSESSDSGGGDSGGGDSGGGDSGGGE